MGIEGESRSDWGREFQKEAAMLRERFVTLEEDRRAQEGQWELRRSDK